MPEGIVFIDYQNVFRGARDAFRLGEPGRHGNVSPFRLGRLIARRAGFELKQVRTYTGVPHRQRNREGHATMQRRIAAWRAESGRVEVYERPLRYPPPQGREKGVDVQLAVDIVRLVIERECEAIALCSADTDLVPALEFVDERFPDVSVTTVSWKAVMGGQQNEPLDLPSGRVTRLRLTQTEFERFLVDMVDYRVRT